MYALVVPDEALRYQELLIDVAAAGDFGTYRYRQAAQASMAVATYADPDRSPIAADLTGPYEEQCAVLYERLLELLPNMALHPDEFAELWIDEDRQLAASEAALATGAITIEERPDIDLAIVDIAASEPERRGHRFAADEYVGVHPMAVNNATRCLRILQVHGRRYTYTDRYESWVQYQSRRPLLTGGLASARRRAHRRGRGHGLDRNQPVQPHRTVADHGGIEPRSNGHRRPAHRTPAVGAGRLESVRHALKDS